MRKFLLLLLALSSFGLCGFDGCGGGPTLPPTTSGGGFFIETLTSFNLSPPVIAPVVQIKGEWVKDEPGAQGNASTWNQTTNGAGIGIINNGRVPADWKFTWVFSLVSACEGQSVTATAHSVDDVVGLLCTVTDVTFGASTNDDVFSPAPVLTDGSTGSEAYITGSGFSSQYGMPLLQYFDLNGNLVAQTNGDGVASDGSWMSSPIPDISQLPLGTYVGFISNANVNGGYDLVGATSVQVESPPSPPDSGCGSGPPYTYCE